MKNRITLPCLSLLLCLWPLSLWADFGLTQVIQNSQTLSLKQNQDAFAILFEAPENLELRSLALRFEEVKGSPSLALNIYETHKGKAGDKAIAVSSLVPSGYAWAVFHFEAANLIQGKKYYLVLQADTHRGGHHAVDSLDKNKSASFAAQSEQNSKPYKILEKKGDNWIPLNLSPVFILHADKDRLYGSSYTQSGAVSIHGNGTPEQLEDDLWQAQALHFKCGSSADYLRLRVRKRGNPQQDLNLEVFKHDYAKHKVSSLHKTVAVKTSEASQEWSWQRVKLSPAAPFPLSPVCHYFAFHSAAGRADEKEGCQDCWQISYSQTQTGVQGAADLTFDGGAHRSRAASSTQGKHWEDFFERDLNVVIEGVQCPENSNVNTLPLPTPEFWP